MSLIINEKYIRYLINLSSVISRSHMREEHPSTSASSSSSRSSARSKTKAGACPECGLRDLTVNGLKEHLARVHQKVKTFRCEKFW